MGNIAPERFPSLRLTQRRRKIQSECSCDDGELGLTGSWSELSKLVCENDSGHWRIEAGLYDQTHQPRPPWAIGPPFPPWRAPSTDCFDYFELEN